MKICGEVVTIKKLAFANSYHTVVDHKQQFPLHLHREIHVLIVGYLLANILLFWGVAILFCTYVHLAYTCNAMAARRNTLTHASSSPRKATLGREAVHLKNPGSDTERTC